MLVDSGTGATTNHTYTAAGTYTATLSLGPTKVQQKIQVTIAAGIETR